MSGNPIDSPWRSTPNERRNRPGKTITMTREAWDALDRLATEAGVSRGELIEAWIRAEADV